MVGGQHFGDSRATLLALLLGLLVLVPLRLFLNEFIQSDFLALAVSIPDDAFYYLLPAWHFPTHGYFTFDGLHKTYGFQPLYMLLLTGLSTLLPSIEAVLRAGLCVNATRGHRCRRRPCRQCGAARRRRGPPDARIAVG